MIFTGPETLEIAVCRNDPSMFAIVSVKFKMTESIQPDRRKDIRFVCLASLLLAVVLLFSAGQAYTQKSDDVIKIETDLVTFEVTVTDSGGRPVRNLLANDFQVFDDGVERKPDFFEVVRKEDTGRPLSIVLALDVSGSMTGPELERLKAALAGFATRLADYNSYFAVTTFAMNVSTVQSFTNRREKLEASITKLKRDQDGLSTHAYDAVDHAIKLLTNKGPKYSMNRLTKRAVVLITDGFPVGDIVAPETVIERAQGTETSVYALILPSYSRFQQTKRPVLTPLEASGLIDRTGGRSFYATNNNFEPLFKSLEDEITATYAIAFYPDKNGGGANAVRNVQIVSRKGLIVKQNRTGYKPPN
jgi:VWFA-related protein